MGNGLVREISSQQLKMDPEMKEEKNSAKQEMVTGNFKSSEADRQHRETREASHNYSYNHPQQIQW